MFTLQTDKTEMRMREKRVVILGAGLAGIVASGALRQYRPEVYDARPSSSAGLGSHKAIMRLRTEALGEYLGLGLDKVVVNKAVLFRGQLYSSASVLMNNLYSLKLYDQLGDRSLWQLGRVIRYLLPKGISVSGCVFFSSKLVRVVAGNKSGSKKLLIFEEFSTGRQYSVSYDVCISTIPLPALLTAVGGDSFAMGKRVDCRYYPICVARAELLFPSSVHQTIYVPERDFRTYRVSIEGKMIIFEGCCSLEEYEEAMGKEFGYLLSFFGLSLADCSNFDFFAQPYGKIVPISDDLRRLVIQQLSVDYDIYSLGRHAIWKPIRADHLVNDVKVIVKMIGLSDIRRRYESTKL